MALGGRHLKVATGLWVPWVDLHNNPDGSFTADGVAITFLNIIAKKLNFTYTLVTPDDMEWGREMPNGSFTGMIGMCERKEVDLALGPFAITYKRSQVAEFSTSLYVESWGIFLPRPRLKGDLGGFLKPLAWQVWVVLAGMMLLTMVGGTVLNWVASSRWFSRPGGDGGGEGGPRTGRAKGVEGGAVFRPSWIIRTIVNEAIGTLPRGATARVLVGTWLVAALVLSTAYQGVLTSLLTVPLVAVPVDSLEDLLHYGKIPWAIEQGTVLQQVFADADSGVYRQIYESASYVVGAWGARQRVKDEELAVFADLFSMRKIIHDSYGGTGECHYYIAKEIIRSAPLAFAFPRRSPLTHHFNSWMTPLKESGLVSRSVLQLTDNATACLVPPGQEAGLGGSSSNLLLTLPDLAGVFLLLAAGLALGTTIAVVERVVYWTTNSVRRP